jgi:hypothetical protein
LKKYGKKYEKKSTWKSKRKNHVTTGQGLFRLLPVKYAQWSDPPWYPSNDNLSIPISNSRSTTLEASTLNHNTSPMRLEKHDDQIKDFYKYRYHACLVYPMFPVSLDCSFLIVPSVFSNVYLYIYVYSSTNQILLWTI